MSTAIPPNPNAIIASLLEVAQAAYVLAYHPSQDLLDNLKKQLNLLEDLPQYCSNPVNGPCRARKYLESFLQGAALADLMEKRTRAFPPVTVTLPEPTPEQLEAIRVAFNQPKVRDGLTVFPVLTADVQRDGTEFKMHTWNAPAEAPHERRLRPRMIEPTTPGLGEKAVDPVVEANRELLLSRSKVGIEKYGVTLAGSGLSKRELLTHALQESLDLANYLQAELQRSEAERNDARANMLAETSDEALKIINDAALLRDLAGLLTEPWSRLTIGQFKGIGWCIEMNPSTMRTGTRYKSTSFHQVIAVASKGEHDRMERHSSVYEHFDVPVDRESEDGKHTLALMDRYVETGELPMPAAEALAVVASTNAEPEHEECKFCGFTVESPCDAPPPAECPTAVAEQLSEAMRPVTKTVGGRALAPAADAPHPFPDESKKIATAALATEKTGRDRMVELLVAVKDVFGVESAKVLFTGFSKVADVHDSRVDEITVNAENKLKEVIG
jgi:hypothetical protein